MTEAAAAAAAADPPLVILVVVMTRVVSRISPQNVVFKKWSVQERKKEKEEVESRTK